MPAADGDALGDKRNVSMVLRLVVEHDGSLLEGEVLDDQGRSGGHFGGWEAMTTAVEGTGGPMTGWKRGEGG